MAHNEQVFTPLYIVDSILDSVNYCGYNIRKKHIIDNSCGNGNFLTRIIERYIDVCIADGLTEKEIKYELKTYIHGIEINSLLHSETIQRIGEYLHNIGFNDFSEELDIRCCDTLFFDEYNEKMDYVVGNPPYCRIHHLDNQQRSKVKDFNFAQGGMTDLYLVFFEIGIKMLNKNGKLGYITPNSWMTSKAGTNFRKWLKDTNRLSRIIQFGNKKIFDNITTFTNITIIDNLKKNNTFEYCYDVNDALKNGELEKSFIDDKFYIGDDSTLNVLYDIANNTMYNKIKVKNGFASLNDKLFFHKVQKNSSILEEKEYNENIIDVYKASNGTLYKGIYPYNKNGKPIDFDKLNSNTQNILLYYAKQYNIDTDKNNWYLYGRSQAINDTYKYKIAISNLISNDIDSIKIKLLEPGVGIFSGLYIIFENDNLLKDNYNKIVYLLKSKDFCKYVISLGKYKNGEYFTFSSKDLHNYLNYNFNIMEND